MQKEKILQKKVKDFLLTYPQVQAINITGGLYGSNGTSDLIANVAGFFVAIECKRTSKNKLTKLQEIFLKEVVEKGGKSFVVHNENFDNFKKVFDLYYKEKME